MRQAGSVSLSPRGRTTLGRRAALSLKPFRAVGRQTSLKGGRRGWSRTRTIPGEPPASSAPFRGSRFAARGCAVRSGKARSQAPPPIDTLRPVFMRVCGMTVRVYQASQRSARTSTDVRLSNETNR